MSGRGEQPLDEVYDTMMVVQMDPCGAWMAIQTLAASLERAEKELEMRGGAVLDLQVQVSTARNDALEEAASEIESANANGLERRICCDGHMCGCHGSVVGEYAAHLIRALQAKP